MQMECFKIGDGKKAITTKFLALHNISQSIKGVEIHEANLCHSNQSINTSEYAAFVATNGVADCAYTCCFTNLTQESGVMLAAEMRGQVGDSHRSSAI